MFLLKLQFEVAACYTEASGTLLKTWYPADGYLFEPGYWTFPSGTTVSDVEDFLERRLFETSFVEPQEPEQADE